MSLTPEVLRAAFYNRLTRDSSHHDRRRKDFNQAVFDPEGSSIWSKVDLDMVMYAFDKAMVDVTDTARPYP